MHIKRSVHLINPSFQIKFSFIVCSVVFISSLIYPVIIYEMIGTISSQFQMKNQMLEHINGRKFIILTLCQLIFISIIFIYCIFQSHRIAGPMYKLQVFLQRIREGHGIEQLKFRQGDNFPEIADEINQTFAYIKDSHNQDFAYLSEVTSYINNLALIVPEDKKAVLLEITSKLLEIQNRFKGQ